MFRLKTISIHSARALSVFLVLFFLPHTIYAQSDNEPPTYSPAVNAEGLRGLTSIGSAESMGEGRITFGFVLPWYRQQTGYLNTPNSGSNIFTGIGAFSYGVNSMVDLFASIAGFSSSNYVNTDAKAGLGTIRAGVQGSLPFPKYAFLRMGGQTAINGGTARNQINTNRADGYNYFETRTGWDITGKLMQTILFGGEDFGIKLHLNEGGILGLAKSDPALLLLGAGLQGNIRFAVVGLEINSRTQLGDISLKTDPLWLTPSLFLRTPWNTNILAGVDISLSESRTENNVHAIEAYRVFGAVAFSIDVLENKRTAEFNKKQKDKLDNDDLEMKAAHSSKQVQLLTMKSTADSLTRATEQEDNRKQIDTMEQAAGILAKKATTDSILLIQATGDLAREKEMRSDAENQLLSTGEILLDAVYFETGKVHITINSKSYLNIIAKMLLKYPKLQFEVAGHTDNIGTNDFNVSLSQGRAEAVKFYLIDVAPALRLSAHGYGMSVPKADNVTEEGRQKNRRVELHVTNMDVLREYSQW
jgi:outer membrane protein OmpA-like peptidoglycan-associated protein